MNLRNPGKGGASAILFRGGEIQEIWRLGSEFSYLPAVDLIDDSIPPRSAMDVFEVLANPVNEVILEDTLDQLV